jgi:hypothetical protein
MRACACVFQTEALLQLTMSMSFLRLIRAEPDSIDIPIRGHTISNDLATVHNYVHIQQSLI